MKKLSKDTIKSIAEVIFEYQEVAKAVDAAITKYNEVVDDARGEVTSVLDEFNSKLSELRDIRDQVVADIDDYTGERSEKWQEGEQAQRYEEWKSQWEEADLEDKEVEIPELLSEFDYIEKPARRLQ